MSSPSSPASSTPTNTEIPATLCLTADGQELSLKEFPYCTIYEPTGIKHKFFTGKPFEWQGGRIPITLWREIISFFLWSYDKYKAESLVQLFYNPETYAWAAWAFPQRGIGMTVNHIEDDPRYNTDREQFPEPWCSFGSVHHHCSAGAFASGTDAQDELKKEGLHITVGELGKSIHGIHVRVSFQGKIYETNLQPWFDLGESEHFGSMNHMGEKFFLWAICKPYTNFHKKEWEDRFTNSNSKWTGGAANPTKWVNGAGMGMTILGNPGRGRKKGKKNGPGSTETGTEGYYERILANINVFMSNWVSKKGASNNEIYEERIAIRQGISAYFRVLLLDGYLELLPEVEEMLRKLHDSGNVMSALDPNDMGELLLIEQALQREDPNMDLKGLYCMFTAGIFRLS